MPALRILRQKRHDEAGAAAVEFGIISVLLFTLLFGIMQYGFYFWAKQAGSAAVREGARRLAVAPNCTTIDDYVKTRVGPASVTWGSATATFTNGEGNTGPAAEVGDVVTLTVQFNAMDLDLPFVPFVADGDVQETAQSRVENVPTTPGAC